MKREASKSVLASIRRVLEGGVYVSEKIMNAERPMFNIELRKHSRADAHIE